MPNHSHTVRVWFEPAAARAVRLMVFLLLYSFLFTTPELHFLFLGTCFKQKTDGVTQLNRELESQVLKIEEAMDRPQKNVQQNNKVIKPKVQLRA